ncbi:MAG: hypothetical protein GX847_08800 [Clostridiales bacterium]|nr:hypothetical protein [Clostridiales bacterium]
MSVSMSQYGSGTGNYGRINETAPDDTNGVSTSIINTSQLDLYGLPNPSQSGTINSVTVHFRARCAYGGTVVDVSYATPQVRIGGTTYSATAQGLGSTFQGYSRAWSTNPNTESAWTWQNINDLIVGLGMNAGTYGDIKSPTIGAAYCSWLYVIVDYTEPVANKLPMSLFFQGVL